MARRKKKADHKPAKSSILTDILKAVIVGGLVHLIGKLIDKFLD
ncbi:hypothetical protein FACS1894120_4300 [Clostridia bacterium]|nr:hypothetical protein FACS1894120_4300 [Clostridia bacterium]